MVDLVEYARDILAANRFAVLATVDAAGEPWATPVWFAHRGLDLVVWVSHADARHSEAIAAVPRVAVTVFDSSVEPGHGKAFYGRGPARECEPDRLPAMLAVFSAESERQGLGVWDMDRVTGSAPLRLYVAELEEASLLIDDGGPDRRVPLDLPVP